MITHFGFDVFEVVDGEADEDGVNRHPENIKRDVSHKKRHEAHQTQRDLQVADLKISLRTITNLP